MNNYLDDVKTKFQGFVDIVLSKPDKTWQGMQATVYLFNVISLQDEFNEKLVGRQLSAANKSFYSEVKKLAKEYENKLYNLAKPFIEDYFKIDKDIMRVNLKASDFLYKLEKCEELINAEKENTEHTEDYKKPQIDILKSFAYYINREFEDKLDSKCRAKYYEILKM